jgi:hypothetical protein
MPRGSNRFYAPSTAASADVAASLGKSAATVASYHPKTEPSLPLFVRQIVLRLSACGIRG